MGWREPRTFAGVPLTGTRSVIEKIFPPGICEPTTRGELSTISCTAQIPFGGAVRNATLEFVGEQPDDYFLSMKLEIARADFEAVEADLARQYGKPGEHTASGGAIHDAWKGKKIAILLDLRAGKGPGTLRVGLKGPIAVLRVRPAR
jgi:hypothetical protein